MSSIKNTVKLLFIWRSFWHSGFMIILRSWHSATSQGETPATPLHLAIRCLLSSRSSPTCPNTFRQGTILACLMYLEYKQMWHMLHLSRGFKSHCVLLSTLFSLSLPRLTGPRKELRFRMGWHVKSHNRQPLTQHEQEISLCWSISSWNLGVIIKLTNVQWKTELSNYTSQITFHQWDTFEWDLEGQREAKDRLLLLVVLASKVRDIRICGSRTPSSSVWSPTSRMREASVTM